MNASTQSLPIPDTVPEPLGNYVAVRITGADGYVSGQFPIRDGVLQYRGRVGADLTVEEGRQAAEICALNALGQIKKAMNGDLQHIELCRIDGYIASDPEFTSQPAVLDGASDLFVHALGTRGLHARTVFAVTHLPANAPIELVVTFRITFMATNE